MKTFRKIVHTAKTLGPRRTLWFASRLLQEPNPSQLWNEPSAFSDLFAQVAPHTLTDRQRCFMLYQLLRAVAEVPGDVAEVGVYRGGTALLLASLLDGNDRVLRLFDTFDGMPEVDANVDFVRKGDFADTSLEAVRSVVGEAAQTEFYPGYFPRTAAGLEKKRFAFVHVDVDIYQSVLDCCAFFMPRLSPGGIMVFDDYGFITTRGARRAVDEFFATDRHCPVYLPTGQAMVTKIGESTTASGAGGG